LQENGEEANCKKKKQFQFKMAAKKVEDSPTELVGFFDEDPYTGPVRKKRHIHKNGIYPHSQMLVENRNY
jgi:hypothetical protein